jgi:AcrR family transcriptional regulator
MTRTTASSSSDDNKSSAVAERRYGGLSAQERNEQRRQKLLEASIQVFGTLGLRKATMRDICNEARIAERYFSEHFASASDAYEAAFKHISEQATTVTGAAMVAAPLNTHDMAIAGLTAFFRFVKEDPRRAQILLIDASSYWRHITIKTNPELNRHALLMKRFAELIYPGLPGSIKLEIIGAALIGASLQSCITWVQSGFKYPIETVVAHLIFAWDGLDSWLKSQIEADKAAAEEPAAVKPAAKKAVAKSRSGTGKSRKT